MEFICGAIPYYRTDEYISYCNSILEQERSGYRFIENKITNIIETQETREIEITSSQHRKYEGAKAHMRAAIDLYAKRPKGDYRNSAKEAISSVESAAKIITNDDKATLGDAVKVLKARGLLHPALGDGISKIYGYASDAEGVRHAMTSDNDISEADARFMIVICSAIVNFLIQTNG